jgi:hypothetical protein
MFPFAKCSLIHTKHTNNTSSSFVARGPTSKFTAPVERGLVFALDSPAQIAQIAPCWGDAFASAASAAAAAQFSAFVAAFTDANAVVTADSASSASLALSPSSSCSVTSSSSSCSAASLLDSAPLLPTAAAPTATDPIGFFDFSGAPSDKRTAGCYRCVRERPARFILLRLFQSNASENVDTNFIGLMSSESERVTIKRRYEERISAAAKIVPTPSSSRFASLVAQSFPFVGIASDSTATAASAASSFSEFDTNGLMYWLGTGRSSDAVWTNPCADRKAVSVIMSSIQVQ